LHGVKSHKTRITTTTTTTTTFVAVLLPSLFRTLSSVQDSEDGTEVAIKITLFSFMLCFLQLVRTQGQ
jgi:hypothetical protein